MELINVCLNTVYECVMSDSEVEVRVRIPQRLLDMITKNIVGSSYSSAEDYIRSLVIETVDDQSAYSEDEEDSVRKRLASLGYE